VMIMIPPSWTVAGLAAAPIRDTGLEDLVAFHRDPLVMAHLGGVRDEEATPEYLKTNIKHWDKHGFGLYVLRAGDGSFVGRAGLRVAKPMGDPEIEVAYALRSEWWGRGAAVAVTDQLCSLASASKLFPEVVAITESTNRRSWRVMQKANFVFDCEFVYQGSPHVLYRRRLPMATPWSARRE
jgi:RimJ/RimL family protein N-acetyltransferase